MYKHLLFYLCLLFSSGKVFAQTALTAEEIKALQTTVQQRAASTTTLTSDFKQYKHISFLTKDIESSGQLNFKKPNLVKWQYKSPFLYTVIFKEGKMYINDQGNKNKIDMSASTMFEQLNTLIINSIKGTMFTDTNFEVSYYKNASQKSAYFKPKLASLKDFFKEIQLQFDQNGEVTMIKMIEPSGDYTRIEFSNKKINQKLPDAVFNP